MRIIISPAKKMVADTDSFAVDGLPVYLERTERLNNGLITHLGRYAIMIVSQDQEAMLAETENLLRNST